MVNIFTLLLNAITRHYDMYLLVKNINSVASCNVSVYIFVIYWQYGLLMFFLYLFGTFEISMEFGLNGGDISDLPFFSETY